MKRGCMITMLKQKCSRRSGWENPRQDKIAEGTKHTFTQGRVTHD